MDLLDIQPEADFVTCNKLASRNLRLVLPFVCLPLLTHDPLESAEIVVQLILALDILRLQTGALSNKEALLMQGKGWRVLRIVTFEFVDADETFLGLAIESR